MAAIDDILNRGGKYPQSAVIPTVYVVDKAENVQAQNQQSALPTAPSGQPTAQMPAAPGVVQAQAVQAKAGDLGQGGFQRLSPQLTGSISSPGIASTPAPSSRTEAEAKTEGKPRLTYEELFEKTSGYRPPTPEELEAQNRKRKREAIFSAIGDGISALSNLYFTTRYAPDSYDPRNGLSVRARERWDRIDKDREGRNRDYYSGYMRARMADDDMASAVRAFDFQKERAKAEDAYRAAEAKARAEREAIRQRERAEDLARQDKMNDEEKERQRKQFEEQKRQFNVREGRMQLTEQANAAASAAKAVRGKQLAFSDGGRNEVGIYENVWKGSMHGVYDVLREEINKAKSEGGEDAKDLPYARKNATLREMDDFVKQHWYKFPRARTLMFELSKIDPATMTSAIDEGGDDIIDWLPEDEIIIDYIPEK